ncbi:MAG: alpha-L-fucosidase [Actinobacteria bacterium]|nr:alpha-L-fucosidase [Actinomycetota bacterium]MCB0920898.1 alpha-L-fucosidase [Actinomycetota bacterium]
MSYQPTWESVSQHPVPGWFDDAKLGIFLHWGLYSVPGWAPQVPDIQQMLREQGPNGMLRNNPYAEWYLNTMRIQGSPTWEHHRQTYGPDFPYDGFASIFNEHSSQADLDALAEVCASAGAQYVVLTTKHHDGFTLWPSALAHPTKGHYHAQRDLVGDLTAAVRSKGLRMGLYYSGGYDWPFNNALLANAGDVALAVPPGKDYADYADGHVRELIEAYAPSVLWNDICWPPDADLAALFAYYYNRVAEGVVNDRWLQRAMPRNAVMDAGARGMGWLLQAGWRAVPEKFKNLTFPASTHYDFRTPEYASFDEIQQKKWEATRGVGHSFGANRNERPEDIITATGVIRMLCDVVSKNGNMLIGIGPDPDGSIPEEQQRPLRGLGEWLAVNGEAIYGTRPWTVAATTTTEGTDVRFTQRDGRVYAILLDQPGVRRFAFRGVRLGGDEVRLLGSDAGVALGTAGDLRSIELPAEVPVSAALVLDLGPDVSWLE